MPPKFHLQSGYKGKETASIVYSYDREDYSYSARSEYQQGQIPVGSVEFVEEYIGVRIPNYYPAFLRDMFKRKIWREDYKPKTVCFIKPADRHKRFDAKIHKERAGASPGWLREEDGGPYWCSEVVEFTDEWRYYVANGKVLAAYWYDGKSQEEIDAPSLNIDWPKDFCGAVDFGRLSNGEIALVENNLPYGCGWYGSYEDGKIYGGWLKAGFEFLRI